MSAETKARLIPWGAMSMSALTVSLLVYWVCGPHELSAWRAGFMTNFNVGSRASKAGMPSRPQVPGHIDKPAFPAMIQTLFSARPGFERQPGEPVSLRELIFTRFIALDALAAVGLALALLRWRRDNIPACWLAWTLALFGFALAAFLVNGQARLRGTWLDWPGWPRLGLDLAATLAFGLSLMGLDRFFSIYPVKLEDWQVLATVRLRHGAAPAKKGRGNLLSLARLVPRIITGILIAGTMLSSLPHLLFRISYTIDTRPDGAPVPWAERLDMISLSGGVLAGLVALGLLMAFGWLLAASLTARLRAGREQCTEEERRRTDWLCAGGLVMALMLLVFSAGLLLGIVYLAWGDSDLVRRYGASVAVLFFPAGWAVLLFTLAGAIFLSKSFGPRPLLKRTVLITGAGVVISFLAALLQHTVVSRLFSQSTAGWQHGVSTALGGGLVVFSFGFFRQRLESGFSGWLDRFMPATVIADGRRREATIMFSDLAGYTALSAANEPQALLVTGYFQKVATRVAPRTNGRIVKTIGDAIMWVFPSPAEAMRAAVLLRDEFKAAVAKENLPALPVNSGLHHGSVVEAPGGDVYGATVNLAARLQGAAKDGIIVASIEAVQEISGDFKLVPMGKLDLKNVPMPVACFQVTAA
jgi:class 3 adenylate cyclase